MASDDADGDADVKTMSNVYLTALISAVYSKLVQRTHHDEFVQNFVIEFLIMIESWFLVLFHLVSLLNKIQKVEIIH